jgi:hypothetical protein
LSVPVSSPPPPVPPPVPLLQPVPGVPIEALPTPAELKVVVVEPLVMAKVALELLPVSLIVKVPVDMVELLEVLVVSCTPSTRHPLAFFVTLVAVQVPLLTTVVLVPPLEWFPGRKRVKLPPPVGVVSPLPYSNK